MILQQQSPPPVNGTADDTARLSSWCASFAQRLKHTLINLDDSNITGMSAAKLDSGTVSLDRVGRDERFGRRAFRNGAKRGQYYFQRQ